jgi:hypothetical protein
MGEGGGGDEDSEDLGPYRRADAYYEENTRKHLRPLLLRLPRRSQQSERRGGRGSEHARTKKTNVSTKKEKKKHTVPV